MRHYNLSPEARLKKSEHAKQMWREGRHANMKEARDRNKLIKQQQEIVHKMLVKEARQQAAAKLIGMPQPTQPSLPKHNTSNPIKDFIVKTVRSEVSRQINEMMGGAQ